MLWASLTADVSMHMLGNILSMMMTRLLRLSSLGVAALLMLAAPAAVWATDHKPAACADHTPHKVRFVKVAPGVELEVLDWGGKGKAMVLLAGGGDNAHVYDQFAYQFTDYFHVIGITRRGYLPSSQPRNGYDIPTRAADDIAVLDALGIEKAVFVGHSAAGMELSRLGQAHKDRVDKLVYLDASDLSERYLPSRLEPPPPDYTDADLKSLWAYQAATARFQALRTPIPALCHGLKFAADGAILDSTTPDWVSNKISAAVSASSPTNWASIKAPRLGIFALFTRRGKAGLVLVSEPGQESGVRRRVGADRRLASNDHSEVRTGQFRQYLSAAWRSTLCLHHQ